jgi:mRNA-degrading endonuclease YafQ of YafQ-DinJ toxin-antitoxin module
MVRYGIPEHYHAGFKELANISSSDLDKLKSILKNIKIGEGIKEVLESNKDVLSITEEKLELILSSLFGMVNVFNKSEAIVEVFAEDFADSYEYLVKSDEEEAERLRSNISSIIPTFTHLSVTMKARELISENANSFIECRIVTDIRLVYESNIEDVPKNALTLHNLRIKVYQDNNYKDIFIALDTNDLHSLSKTIERAIQKDTLIKENNSNLHFIDIK